MYARTAVYMPALVVMYGCAYIELTCYCVAHTSAQYQLLMSPSAGVQSTPKLPDLAF